LSDIVVIKRRNDKLEGLIMNKRADFVNVTEEQDKRMFEARVVFSKAFDFLDEKCKESRETSLAITKLEEALFWTIKGITRENQTQK
jgi:hypothetical protein